MFGPFASLLDFLRRMQPHQVSRRELQALIRLGAFSFTGRSRAQLALVEDVYASTGELLLSTDRDPADVGPLDDECPICAHTNAVEWPRSGSPRTNSPFSAFTSSRVIAHFVQLERPVTSKPKRPVTFAEIHNTACASPHLEVLTCFRAVIEREAGKRALVAQFRGFSDPTPTMPSSSISDHPLVYARLGVAQAAPGRRVRIVWEYRPGRGSPSSKDG
jgi:hypothetical protein